MMAKSDLISAASQRCALVTSEGPLDLQIIATPDCFPQMSLIEYMNYVQSFTHTALGPIHEELIQITRDPDVYHLPISTSFVLYGLSVRCQGDLLVELSIDDGQPIFTQYFDDCSPFDLQHLDFPSPSAPFLSCLTFQTLTVKLYKSATSISEISADCARMNPRTIEYLRKQCVYTPIAKNGFIKYERSSARCVIK